MIKGKVHRYGSNVDTDVIIPARYLNTTDPRELASTVMEDSTGVREDSPSRRHNCGRG